MPFSLSNSWSEPAVRIAAAGVGFMVGGPLGVALGGWHGAILAGALGECGKALAEECAEKFGNQAAKKMFGADSSPLADELKKPSNNLEQVYRKALYHSLEDVRSHISPDFESWFANWRICLASNGPLDVPRIHPDQLVAQDLDPIFQRTMEQFDAQGSALSRKSVSLKQERRTIPEALLSKLAELLPEHFQKWFHDLIHKPEYEKAWKEKQQQFQDSVTSLLASIKSDTSQILTGQGGLNEKLDELLRRTIAGAERDQRIDRAEARALSAEAEAEEWKRKFIELTKSNPSLDELLSSGDFEAAALKKTQQLEKQSSGLAQSYFELGTIHELRFDWPKALAAYREAWRIEPKPEFGFCYGYSASIQNKFAEAISVYEALHKTRLNFDEVAKTVNNLGTLYKVTQRTEEAEHAYCKALSIYRELAHANPTVQLPQVAFSLNNLGILYSDTQRLKEAEEAYLESLSIQRKLVQENADLPRDDLANVLKNLGGIYSETQRLEQAEQAFEESLSIFRKLAEEKPETSLLDVALGLYSLAAIYRVTQRMEKSEEACLESVSILRELAQSNPEAYLPDFAMAINILAVIYSDTQQVGKSEEMHREALSIRRDLAKENPEVYLPEVARTLNNIAILVKELGRFAEAEKAHNEALSIRRNFALENPQIYGPEVAMTLHNLGCLYRVTQRIDEAVDLLSQSLELYRSLAVSNPTVYDSHVAATLHELAEIKNTL